MELPPPGSFTWSSATESLVADVDELARRVNEFRPLTPELVAAVHEKLFPERVYSSNAIEGNTLTLRETIEILTTGHVSNRRRREGTEAQNLGQAVRHLEERLLPEPNPYLMDRFLELHAILLKDLEPRAGQFRDDRRMITGATYQPPRPELVPGLTERILDTLRDLKEMNAVKLAAWAHWSVARVHPFSDGNGRMARLWQDLVLLRARLAPAIIRLQDRDQNGYYDTLAAADAGDLNPLTQLIAQRAAATLEQYISAQQQASELGTWADKLASELASRVAEERKAQYLRWSRVMESLRDDFQRCAAKITASGIEVQFRRYVGVDETAWDNIRNGIGATHTWFFTLSFRHRDKSLRYIFFFGKHFWKTEDTEVERSEPRVSLLISEQEEGGKGVLLYEIRDCPLAMREIFVVATSLIAVTLRPGGDPERDATYVRDANGLKLAQEFIEQVILRRLT
jgi:Fic family protein